MIFLGTFLILLSCTWLLMWAVLVTGLMVRAARHDPEKHYVRLSRLKRLTGVVIWFGFAAALLSAPLFFGDMLLGDPLMLAVALALFLLDMRLDSRLGHTRSLLIVHRIDNGTYRTDRVA